VRASWREEKDEKEADLWRSRAYSCETLVSELHTKDVHNNSLVTLNRDPSHILFMASNKMEGRREDALVKQRLQAREEYQRQKQILINETEKARPSANRFVGQNDSMEESLKNSTVGLVKLEDFQQRRKELEEQKIREAARSNELKYVTIFPSCPLFFSC